MAKSSPIRLAADVGGTFTDVAAFNETSGELQLGKTLTTPSHLVSGIEHGVARTSARFQAAEPKALVRMLHPSTSRARARLARNAPVRASP